MARRLLISTPLKCLKYSSLLAGLLQGSLAFGVCVPSTEVLQKINNTALKHGIEPSLVRAIASVESCFGKYTVNSATLDYGIMQINHKNIKALGLEPQDLISNHDLSLEVATKMLKDLKRRGNRHGVPWQCRYNIGNQKHESALRACRAYLQKLRNAGYNP
jgi:soluble lytic murein transglycosylase-like protein